jgi:hypoxanthine phosphoribosyltransferase
MEKIKVLDKEFVPYLSEQEIDQAIEVLADRINEDYKDKKPLFLIVLNGAFMFASDLLKKLTIDCEISFVKLSSYQGTESTHTVRELIGLDHAIKGRNIVVVEDIIDTGITMAATLPGLRNFEAKSVELATLLHKPEAFQKDFNIKYIGLNIPNKFVVGYGLDYDGYGRNLKEIYQIAE